jgi:hypothetical protein
MKFFNKTLLLFSAFLLLILSANAQQFKDNAGLWSEIGEKQIPKVGKRYITPLKYRTMKLNLTTLKYGVVLSVLVLDMVGHSIKIEVKK